jgi:peptidoglycan/LPS O-acetylase OafA/YrhL
LTSTDEKIHHHEIGKHEEFVSRRFFGSLDGLRAISVIAVIWHHTRGTLAVDWPLIEAGHHGVTLFFAISGFLITSLLLRERQRSGKIDLKAFYIRRSLRIFPLYYAVIAMYVLLVLVMERNSQVGREFFNNLPFFLTYTSNWFVPLEGRVIFYFAWSLAAEEQFYLVWPGIQKLLRPEYALFLVTVLIVVVTAAQWMTADYLHSVKSLPLKVLISIPLAICLGVLLAHALHFKRGFHALRVLLGARASSLVWMLVFLAVLNWGSAPTIVVHAVAVMLVGACIYREDHILAGVLKIRPLAYIGTVSYGVYLLHMLVKNAVSKVLITMNLNIPSVGPFILTTLFSVLVAGFSFRYFESRFLEMKKKLTTTSA